MNAEKDSEEWDRNIRGSHTMNDTVIALNFQQLTKPSVLPAGPLPALSRVQWPVKPPIEAIRSDFIVTSFLKTRAQPCGNQVRHIHRMNKVARILAQEGNINPNYPHLPRNLITRSFPLATKTIEIQIKVTRGKRERIELRSRRESKKNRSENYHRKHRVVTGARSHVALERASASTGEWKTKRKRQLASTREWKMSATKTIFVIYA